DTAGDQDSPGPQQGGRVVGTTGCRRGRQRPPTKVFGLRQDRGRAKRPCDHGQADEREGSPHALYYSRSWSPVPASGGVVGGGRDLASSRLQAARAQRHVRQEE